MRMACMAGCPAALGFGGLCIDSLFWPTGRSLQPRLRGSCVSTVTRAQDNLECLQRRHGCDRADLSRRPWSDRGTIHKSRGVSTIVLRGRGTEQLEAKTPERKCQAAAAAEAATVQPRRQPVGTQDGSILDFIGPHAVPWRDTEAFNPTPAPRLTDPLAKLALHVAETLDMRQDLRIAGRNARRRVHAGRRQHLDPGIEPRPLQTRLGSAPSAEFQ